MANTTISVDLSRVERRLDNMSEALKCVNDNVCIVGNSVEVVRNDLYDLRNRFEKMIEDQRKTAALQKAATELVRVRQELEQNFGNYRVIRETMLGVLQATDLALVKKTTISRVSEELMLSTPKYWLAPCLVAVAAWIGNDRDLANRAITEAVKRDEERTALTMALICRRNNRTEACYEWLSIYFANQDAADFSEGSFVYIDAYINGVFGPDKMHMCDDYINKWLKEIKGSSTDFENSQKEIWKKYCTGFTCNISGIYPDLKACVKEYNQVGAYLERIHSVDIISEKFTGIMSAEIDQEHMKEIIDKKLIELISRYNDDEEPLRKEEEYLKAVRRYNGDEAAARHEIVTREKMREKKTMNLIEQMTNTIITPENVSSSQKKTAISFLREYINKGFEDYVEEKKSAFPKSITMNVNGWFGTTEDGSNVELLKKSYSDYVNTQYAQRVDEENARKPGRWIITAGVFAALAIVMFILPLCVHGFIEAMGPCFGVILVVATIICICAYFGERKKKQSRMDEIYSWAAYMGQDGANRIVSCTAQWSAARQKVQSFNEREKTNIVA